MFSVIADVTLILQSTNKYLYFFSVTFRRFTSLSFLLDGLKGEEEWLFV